MLDQVARRLAGAIPVVDRMALRHLYAQGFRMMVASCGTADLSTRVLKAAGLFTCFEQIAGNRFALENGAIAGLERQRMEPEDKVALVQDWGLKPETCIAVGDGYTDIPLLDWAATAVVIDRRGTGKNRFPGRDYRRVSSVAAIPELLEHLGLPCKKSLD